MKSIIDLRSDTVTIPDDGMIQHMMHAVVGDDVYGEDPTVAELETYVARLFGKEAALFCVSGTMANQIAIKVHTQPGNEVICADNAHIFKYEGGGMASLSGVQARVVSSSFGKITPDQIETCINTSDIHFPKTALVSIENSSNRGGGSVYSLSELSAVSTICKKYQLPLHMDGARVWNALIAGGYTAQEAGHCVDTLAVCLSKGLGAPVGSLLVGSTSFIHQALRIRKALGGGMRQAGYLAAAGLYALKHNMERLKTDHKHALQVKATLQQRKDVALIYPVETNIIIFECTDAAACDNLHHTLAKEGIKTNKISPKGMRFVFHLNISSEMVQRLCYVLQ